MQKYNYLTDFNELTETESEEIIASKKRAIENPSSLGLFPRKIVKSAQEEDHAKAIASTLTQAQDFISKIRMNLEQGGK